MLELTAGVLMGIAGAMHCVGMCGPLVLLTSVSANKRGSWLLALQYQGGRVIGYVIIGLLISSVMRAISFGQFATTITLVAGTGMVVGAMMQLAFHRSMLPSTVARPLTRFIAMLSGKLGKRNITQTALLRGGLNSLLPCGLSMAAFMASVTLPAAWQVIMFMIGFGIGTMPGLIGVSALGGALRGRFLRSMHVMGPVLVIISGLLILLRGLSLGIPLVSPDVNHMLFHARSGCCVGD